MTLLASVASTLESAGVSYALIGAGALSVHGVNRATLDLDLLAVDSSCLQAALWMPLESQGVAVDIRKGDVADPLAGVVRFRSAVEGPIDLVIGKPAWQREIVERALPAPIEGLRIPVVRPSDLVLLKLYAGGPQDRWDIQQLLAGEDGDRMISEVEQKLVDLPPGLSRAWREIRELGGDG